MSISVLTVPDPPALGFIHSISKSVKTKLLIFFFFPCTMLVVDVLASACTTGSLAVCMVCSDLPRAYGFSLTFFSCFFLYWKRFICSLCQTQRKDHPPRAVIRRVVVFGSPKLPLLQFLSTALLIKRAVLPPAGIKICKATNPKAMCTSHFATSWQ